MSSVGVVLEPERSDPAPTDPAPTDGMHPTGDGGTRSGRRSFGSVGALALMIGGIAALISARPISDNSFLTHLATGRLIVESGLPTQNPFLYSSTSFPVPSYWWSIALGVVDDLGGGSALRLLTGLLGGLLGVLLVRLAAGAPGRRSDTVRGDGAVIGDGPTPGLLAVVVPAALTLMCVFQFLSGRPHLIGFVLLALMVLVWRERRSPWWLVPIFTVWVNVHGSWLYGLVVIGMFVVAEVVDSRRLPARQMSMIATAVLGALLGGALYPDRFALILLPTRQFGDPIEREALQAYNEWRRVGLDEPMLWMMVGLALLALYGCIRQRRYAMTAVVALLVAMGVSGLRLVPIAAIALVPFAALGLSGIGTLRLPTGRAAMATKMVGGLICLGAVTYSVMGPAYELSSFPVEATDWLEARDLVGNDTKVVTHDIGGNYLEWRFGDRANTWVDDRPGAATLLDYAELQRFTDDWSQALDRADGDVLIWETRGKLTGALEEDPDWVVGTTAGSYTVFCRVELADRCA